MVQVEWRRQLDGVLREQIEIQIVERLRRGDRETLRRGGSDTIDELRQRRVSDERRGLGAEIEIVQAQPAAAQPNLNSCRPVIQVRLSLIWKRVARRPCTQLLSRPPTVVNGAFGPTALQHDRKGGQCL